MKKFNDFIDTNFIDDNENISQNDKFLVFVLSNTYSLLTAIYYSIKLPEYKCIAIWDKGNVEDYNLTFEFAKKFFYKFFFIQGVRGKNKFVRWMYKVNYVGYLHKNSAPFRFLRKCTKKIFYVFNDIDCITQVLLNDFGLENLVILGDEGAGIYNSRSRNVNSLISRFLAFILLGVNYKSKYIGNSNRIDVLMLKYPNMVKNRDILSNKQVIQANNPFADDEFVKLISNDLKLNELICVDRKCKYYLYIGSPISDLGISESKEVELLGRLVNCLSEDEVVIIKSHPRENEHKYDDIINNKNVILINPSDSRWIPIELIVKRIDPICVVTVMSAAAYNMVQNGDCVYAIYLLNCLGGTKYEFLNDFVQLKGVFAINTIDEFNHIKNNNIKKFISLKKNSNKNKDLEFLKNVFK